MAGRKREVSVAADASQSVSVENTVFIKKTAYESVERHRVKSRFRKPVGNADFRSLNEQHFWNRAGEAVLGHSDSKSRSEQSTPEVVW
jgi:hypothetical protein